MTDTTPRRPGPEVPTDHGESGLGPGAKQAATADLDAGSDAGRAFAIAAAQLLHDYRCEDVVVFDVRGLSEVTNYILLATGSSDRQLKSAARYLGDLAGEHGMERLGSERDEASTWVVLDYVEVMVHLFEPVTRAHYDLEMLWGDAERVRWRQSG
jgi:ribosome-associated protein